MQLIAESICLILHVAICLLTRTANIEVAIPSCVEKSRKINVGVFSCCRPKLLGGVWAGCGICSMNCLRKRG